MGKVRRRVISGKVNGVEERTGGLRRGSQGAQVFLVIITELVVMLGVGRNSSRKYISVCIVSVGGGGG